MHLKSLKLSHFRNFEKREFSFEPGLNCIVGHNGIGKTNLLEAIFLLSTGKSFRGSELKELIRYGEKAFFIEAEFEVSGISQTLILSFDGKSKEMRYNQTRYSQFTNLLGILPSVVHAPSDIALIGGFPKDRRRFINLHIAQKDPLYVYSLARYSKALLQRNSLLKQKKLETIDIWEEEMLKSAFTLMEKRKQMILSISSRVLALHKQLQSKEETPEILYRPSIQKPLDRNLFLGLRERELFLGYTLLGPHRDDLEITLGGKSAKDYASEGQKRTILSSLKLAEYKELEDALLLIDDFGVHLDFERKTLLKEQMALGKQVFLTMPEELTIGAKSHLIHI